MPSNTPHSSGQNTPFVVCRLVGCVADLIKKIYIVRTEQHIHVGLHYLCTLCERVNVFHMYHFTVYQVVYWFCLMRKQEFLSVHSRATEREPVSMGARTR